MTARTDAWRGMLRLAWWNLRGRRARSLLVVLCLAVAVLGRVAVGTVVAGVERHTAEEARALVGGDLELTASRPFTGEEQAAISAALPPGTRQMQVQGLVTMAVSGTVRARPIELRAVPDGYPLVGTLAATAPASVLSTGAALVQADLLTQLDLQVGEGIRLGEAVVPIAGIIREEPGWSASPFSAGPRVLISTATLGRTGLAAHGARIRHVTLMALADPGAAPAAARAVKQALGQDPDSRPPPGAMGPPAQGITVTTAADAQAQTGRVLERFADYVRLATLVSLLVGGVGVASLVRGQIMESLDEVAVLRVVGASAAQVRRIFLLQAVLLGLLGGLVGTAGGAGAAALLAAALPGWGLTPRLEWQVLLGGVALGTGTAGLFAWLPLTELAQFTPLAILRRDHRQQGSAWRPFGRDLGLGLGLIVLVLLLLAAWDSRSWRTGPALLGTVLLAAVVLQGIARGCLPLLARWRPRRPWLALAFSNLGRPGYRPVAAVMAIGLATFLITVLMIYRASFVAELDPSRNGGIPSLFVIDLQVDELDDFRAFLAAEGVADGATQLAPMVRARYRDTRAVAATGTREAEQERFFRNREQNLSWRDEPGRGNTIVAGRWLDPHGTAIEASLEERYAARLGVGLGDRVTFDVQGVEVTATVTSLRRVDWATFSPNFFVLLTPQAISGAPQTWIASLPSLPEARRQAVQAHLAARFPGATAFDVTAIGVKIAALIERLVVTMQAIAVLAVATGLAVLMGMALATVTQRREDHALLLVLGARRRQLMAAIASEFALIGGLSAILGATLAVAASWFVVAYVIGLAVTLPWAAIPVLVGLVAGVCAAIGSWACREAWRVSPLAVLRAEFY